MGRKHVIGPRRRGFGNVAVAQPEHVEARQPTVEGHRPGGVEREQGLLRAERAAEPFADRAPLPFPRRHGLVRIRRIEARIETGPAGAPERHSPGEHAAMTPASHLLQADADQQHERAERTFEVATQRVPVAADHGDVASPRRKCEQAHEAETPRAPRKQAKQRAQGRRHEQRTQHVRRAVEVEQADFDRLWRRGELRVRGIRHPFPVVRQPERQVRGHRHDHRPDQPEQAPPQHVGNPGRTTARKHSHCQGRGAAPQRPFGTAQREQAKREPGAAALGQPVAAARIGEHFARARIADRQQQQRERPFEPADCPQSHGGQRRVLFDGKRARGVEVGFNGDVVHTRRQHLLEVIGGS